MHKKRLTEDLECIASKGLNFRIVMNGKHYCCLPLSNCVYVDEHLDFENIEAMIKGKMPYHRCYYEQNP